MLLFLLSLSLHHCIYIHIFNLFMWQTFHSYLIYHPQLNLHLYFLLYDYLLILLIELEKNNN